METNACIAIKNLKYNCKITIKYAKIKISFFRMLNLSIGLLLLREMP